MLMVLVPVLLADRHMDVLVDVLAAVPVEPEYVTLSASYA
jgi:hypothetical protein